MHFQVLNELGEVKMLWKRLCNVIFYVYGVVGTCGKAQGKTAEA